MNTSLKSIFIIGAIYLTPISHTDAALLSRIDGQAYYDDKLDVTWLADAAKFGFQTWEDANTLVSTFDLNGISEWRLPNIDVNNDGIIIDCSVSSEALCLDNEIAYNAWYNGITFYNPGLFNYIISDFYWTSNEATSDPNSAYIILPDNRSIPPLLELKTSTFPVWAVKSGDVFASPVPIPASFWLFVSGVAGIFGFKKSSLIYKK